MKKLFTSESVTEGHPDKVCDILSDSVLDAHLARTQVAGFHRARPSTTLDKAYILLLGI